MSAWRWTHTQNSKHYRRFTSRPDGRSTLDLPLQQLVMNVDRLWWPTHHWAELAALTPLLSLSPLTPTDAHTVVRWRPDNNGETKRRQRCNNIGDGGLNQVNKNWILDRRYIVIASSESVKADGVVGHYYDHRRRVIQNGRKAVISITFGRLKLARTSQRSSRSSMVSIKTRAPGVGGVQAKAKSKGSAEW